MVDLQIGKKSVIRSISEFLLRNLPFQKEMFNMTKEKWKSYHTVMENLIYYL